MFINGEASRYSALGPEEALPLGAVVVEALFEPGAAKPAMLFVMEKQTAAKHTSGEDWAFLIVSPDGIVQEQGRTPLCIRCHAEAPHHFIFGPPHGTL